MSVIKIYDLNPVGSELFCDCETYLKELLESKLHIGGGYVPPETEQPTFYPLPITRPQSPLCITPFIR